MRVMVDTSLDEDGSLVIVIKNPQRILKQKVQDKPKSAVSEFIGYFCDRYSEKYNVRPVVTQKDVGCAKNLLKSMSLEKLQKLVVHYLDMNEFFFIKKRHDLTTFQQNLNAVHVSLETGVTVSNKTARTVERTTDSLNAARSWLGNTADT